MSETKGGTTGQAGTGTGRVVGIARGGDSRGIEGAWIEIPIAQIAAALPTPMDMTQTTAAWLDAIAVLAAIGTEEQGR